MPQMRGMATPDFEKILPIVLSEHVPTGVVGFLLAGLAAAFMSNFAAPSTPAPAYVVNDIYKRFINPNSGGRRSRAQPPYGHSCSGPLASFAASFLQASRRR